jgi:hypothetical protein
VWEKALCPSSEGTVELEDSPFSLTCNNAKSLELYEIMNDVLLSLYKPVSDDNAEDIHSFHTQVWEKALCPSSEGTVELEDSPFSLTCNIIKMKAIFTRS